MDQEIRPPAEEESRRVKRRRLGRWLPLGVLVALMAVAFTLGLHDTLSFKTIALNYEQLRSFIGAHLAAALAAYMLVYIAIVALSLPGGLLMTVAGGLLFGWKLGTPATVLAATAGATIIFLIAKTSFGETFAARAGPWLARLREGFREHALSYMLFLRLVPAFPFVVVNLAPALLGVPLSTFVLGTLIGIIPGTIAFSMAGAGLGSVVEAQNRLYQACAARHPGRAEEACPYTIDTGALVTRELVAALVLLGLVALMPVALKIWRKRDAAA